MPHAWNTSLAKVALLLGGLLLLAGCNTISGTIGGAGKDIALIGNTIAGVAGCNHPRCGNYKKDCGPRGCRNTRQVVSRCGSRGCDRGYRSPRYERVSYRDRYAYRDRYSYRRDRHCC